MSVAALATVVLVVLVAGYSLYGGMLARIFRLRREHKTPAHEINDGMDFVPTPRFYLLGQHFSAIAAAGPIAGPILACQLFGWLPSLLWIGIGVVFIGAVHDFTSLIASVRHGARSIAEIVREHIGPRAWRSILVFIWLSLVYVIVAFTDITASTFVGVTQEFPLQQVSFNAGGAVALASLLYLLLALCMGFIQKRWNPALWKLTLFFVPATLFMVWLGTQASTLLVFASDNPVMIWGFIILAYCFAASLAPVWSLLQPRGYLGGFVLYLVIALGIIGVFFGGYQVVQPAFKGWAAPTADGGSISLFPFLFVTIACGACSGFHGLVCSGTTSKQIAHETDCRMVGYGAMLMEGFVAVISLVTIVVLTQEQTQGLSPGTIYGNGIGSFLTLLLGEQNRMFAVTFGAMAFSTFVFDTLDVATRLGRFILQELFGLQGRRGQITATALTLLPAYMFIASAEKGAYLKFWTLFGTSNQLLAGLTLLAVTIWLMRSGRPYWFTLVPMVFVLSITLWALTIQFGQFTVAAWNQGFPAAFATAVNAMAALLLLGMTAIILWEAVRAVARDPALLDRAEA